LDLLGPGLHGGGQMVDAASGEVTQATFHVRPRAPDRVDPRLRKVSPKLRSVR
jgi:hypothetical protein